MSDEKKAVCLKLENVSKVFAKVESDQVTHALQDVSVEMSGGEFVSLVGGHLTLRDARWVGS